MSAFEGPSRRNYRGPGDDKHIRSLSEGQLQEPFSEYMEPGFSGQERTPQSPQPTEASKSAAATRTTAPSLEQRIVELGNHFVAPASRGDYEAAVREEFKNPTSSSS